MKNSKKILIIAITMIFLISGIMPIYAAESSLYYQIITLPSDIGSVNALPNYLTDNRLIKSYVVMQFNTNINDYDININVQYKNVSNVTTNGTINLKFADNRFYISHTAINSWVSQLLTYTYNERINIADNITFYIPIYTYNVDFISIDNNYTFVDVNIYSSTDDESTIAIEAFNLGYTNGYNTGYHEGIIDAADYQRDLNLVEHCEQLLGTFVGEDYAHYITPLCLALVVILIYFLFIRWLLALVKSKNVTRVADIIVCTACIIMLVIMYAPMLDLTIHQAQTVYQITADTVVGG